LYRLNAHLARGRGTVLTQAELKRLLHYDPETGIWTNLRTGHRTGCTPSQPYRKITFQRKGYYAHRLAWFYVTGEWPPSKIDHKNNDPTDNRWSNLRLATDLQNVANCRIKKQNKVGLKGVIRAKEKNRWTAQISVNYHSTHLGTFNCPAAAHFAYLIAATREFGEFARHA
jgi:hypothetical protein